MQLPPLVFGAMAHHGAGDDDARVRVMRAAMDAGLRAFDTAPLYGFGVSEQNVGRAVAGADDALVLTKVGLTWGDTHGEVLFETPTHRVRKDSRPESVLREIDQSLERLGRAHIDLVQVHHRDVHVPIAETMSALLEAKAAGKVGAIGVSNYGPDEVREAARAVGDEPLFSVQDQYNLLHRAPERALLPTCRELGVGFLVFSPLAQGVLAGSQLGGRRLSDDDWRKGDPKFFEKNLADIHEALEDTVRPIAERHDASLAQVALAWLLAEPGVGAVIAGARTAEHARSNAGAAALELEASERATIRSRFERLRLRQSAGRRAHARQLAKRGLRKLGRLLGRDR